MVTRNKNPKKEDVIKTAIKQRRWSVFMVIRNENKKRRSRQRKIKRTIEKRIDAHAGLKKCGFICYSNVIIQCIASCSHLTDFLQCPPNEEHEHFQLYFEFTSVINSLVSGGDNVVNLKKLNTLYRDNENFKRDEGKYH